MKRDDEETDEETSYSLHLCHDFIFLSDSKDPFNTYGSIG